MMTPDALAALARSGLSRRDFLKTSGALVVSFSASATVGQIGLAQGQFDTRASHIDPKQLDAWIAIAADGRVTAYTGKCEFGQGMFTAQTQLVAEELSVPFDRVTLIQCDTAVCPDQGTTSGSQSTPSNFNDANLAQAAATARETLWRLASARLGVAVDQLSMDGGALTVSGDRSKRVTYGELVAGKKLNVAVDGKAKRKPAAEWKVLGTPAPRAEIAAMATGQFEFVQNVRVPGMLHGAVVRPPTVGATLVNVDEASVRAMPGFVKVVVRNDFVGVVCQKPWQAMQAAGALKASWTEGTGLPPQREFYDYLRKQPSRDAFVVNSKDVDETLAKAHTVIRATYLHPYQMHGSMGASVAVADVQGDKATVWASTQSAYPTRSGVALLLGVPADNVRVVYTQGAGCYGINGADTVAYDAALLSHGVGKPVRVQLSRRDEMAWENYGMPFAIDQRVGIDASGTIIGWDHEAWFASLGGRPGYDTPGNVVTGMLAGFPTAPFRPGQAAEPIGEFRNGSNAAPSYVSGRVAGSAGGAGTIVSERVLVHTVRSPFFTGPLRSPARLQNTFAHECVLDEVAARVNADPVAYRLRHLRDPRLKEVVAAAAKAANWLARPSPRPGLAKIGVAGGRGFSCVHYEGDNGYIAMVAEVDVDQATGKVIARRLVVAQDCGPVSNPDGMRNQLEGGALQGLSRALGEEVTWDDRKVTSVDWRTYHSLPLGFEVPVIESVLINRTDAEANGAGETAITIVAAAVGNAIFDATGARVREVPFTPERVSAALRAR
jgi:nicotinate dehydrogenase subunit B